MKRPTWVIRRWRSPTNARWLAWFARIEAREGTQIQADHRLPNFAVANDLHLVLLAPSQRAYAQICQLITMARIESTKKGTYRPVARPTSKMT